MLGLSALKWLITMTKETAQKKANRIQNSKRKGSPSFSPIRLDSAQQKKEIDDVFGKFKTRKEALILATELLKESIDND